MNVLAVVPPMVCCAVEPFRVTVAPLPRGLNVPLFVQLPLSVMFQDSELTSSVVPVPMLRFPLTVMFPPSVRVEAPPTSRFPVIVAAVLPVQVLLPVPLVFR